MALRGVQQEFVLAQEHFCSAHTHPTIDIQHHQVETRNAVFFVAVPTIEVVDYPVHAWCLGQLVQLVKRGTLIMVVCGDIGAVADNHLRQI